MTQLLVLREQLKSLCSKYEVYLVPVGKFVTAMITFLIINANIGYMEKLAKFPIVLILALLCSFLPLNFIVVAAAGLSLVHVYALSMECALVVGIIYVLMFLLYFRFSPKDTFAVLLTPICCALQVPYAIPMVMGLVATPASVVSVGCGVVVYHILKYIKASANALTALDADDMVSKIKYLIDGIIGNKEMIVMVVAFAATIVIVYFVRRMHIDYAWTIAIIVGGLTNILILLIGDLMYTTNISILGVLLGSVLAFAVVKVLQFFVFNVDYARTERVQFEDDEYYYYVKAVPKVNIATPEKKVKKVSAKANDDNELSERAKARLSRTRTGEKAESIVRHSSVERVSRSAQGERVARNAQEEGSVRRVQGERTVRSAQGERTVRRVQEGHQVRRTVVSEDKKNI